MKLFHTFREKEVDFTDRSYKIWKWFGINKYDKYFERLQAKCSISEDQRYLNKFYRESYVNRSFPYMV
ncbi:MAG: hypothetical protein ACTSR8_17785 [Promethearchaeota archaeon]